MLARPLLRAENPKMLVHQKKKKKKKEEEEEEEEEQEQEQEQEQEEQEQEQEQEDINFGIWKTKMLYLISVWFFWEHLLKVLDNTHRVYKNQYVDRNNTHEDAIMTFTR